MKSNRPLKQTKYEFDDAQTKVSIKDLCPEDKAKIGDLIKKLAQEQEEKLLLQQQLKEKETEHEKKLKKYKQLSDSAKKEKSIVEDKFKESLAVIKKLQEQDSLIQQQLLYNHVTKFDSFTQCDAPIQNENKPQNFDIQQPPPQIKKSEILQLKDEIEEITKSLKQMKFNDDAPTSPPKRYARSKPPSALQQRNEEKSIQTDLPITKIVDQSFNQNSQIRFYDEFKQLENKLQKQRPLDIKYSESSRPETRQLQSDARENESDDEELNIAKILLQKKHERINSLQNSFRKSSTQPKVILEPEQPIKIQDKYSSSYTTQNFEAQYKDYIREHQKHENTLQSQLASQQLGSIQLTSQQLNSQQLTSQQLQASHNFKTNSLSFNLTNEQQTPTPGSNKLSKVDQFGSSMLQTPLQQSLNRKEDQEELDTIISSLNGRSFNRNKPKPLAQQLNFDDHELGRQIQSNTHSHQYDLDVRSQHSSSSSIPKEEYQKLIDKYLKLANDFDQNDSHLMSD